MLTLQSRTKEGHLAYPSQSDYPTKGTTVGGPTDDPGRQHTRNAPACHAPGAGAEQRQCRLPAGRDLPDAVLPLAQTLRALRAGGPASAAPPGPAWPATSNPTSHGAAGVGLCPGLADLGLCPGGRTPGAAGPGARVAQHGAPDPAPGQPADAPRAARGPGGPHLPHGGPANRTHSPTAQAGASGALPPRRRCPASSSVWTPFTLGNSKASARSGRSRPAMRRAPTG